jgi:hypothetical protein
MDSHFLSWHEPIVQSTVRIKNEDGFLSWDRPVLVKKEQANGGDGVLKASFPSWGAPTSESTRIGKPQSGKENGKAGVSSNKLTGAISSASKRNHSLAIHFV